MSEELTDLPEIESADLSAAMGIETDPNTDIEAQPDEPTDPPADDDTGADPNTPPDPADPNADLPQYRRDAIANRERERNELMGRIDRLEQALAAKNAPPPAVVQPGEELTPEQKAVQEKFFKLFPAARRIFENADAIVRASEVAPGLASQAEEADNMRATGALQSVQNSVAARVLGAGKTGSDLRPEARRRIASAFATYCGADYAEHPEKMPADVRARALRYQANDPKLFDEFASDYVSDFTPVNRPQRVADITRATARSPRGGPSSAPPPASPKPPDLNDEDAVHKAAFASLRAGAAAT